MNKTVIICCTITVICVGTLIGYSEQNQRNVELEFVKSGLEQCKVSQFDDPIWVKNCPEYIKSRGEN